MLGFPCNQFAKQEPGTNEEILAFAKEKYDVNFPMFAKIKVNGEGACELYRILKAEQPEDGSIDGASGGIKGALTGFVFKMMKSSKSEITWNFTKFVINREGQVVKRLAPQTKPKDIAGFIESLL